MAVTKRAGSWTYDDLYELPDRKQYEIIYGELFELPPPSLEHQKILIRLILLVAAEAEKLAAEIVCAPVGVFMPDTDPVQPDLLILTKDRLRLQSKRGVEGAPDLVAEILSPCNTKHDRVTKRLLYAGAGVTEYWIIDPDARSVEVLVLEDGGYKTYLQASEGSAVMSTVLPGLSFPAPALFK